MVRVREVHVTMEAEVNEMPLLERSHQPRNSGSLCKLKKTKDFLIETEMPADTLILFL